MHVKNEEKYLEAQGVDGNSTENQETATSSYPAVQQQPAVTHLPPARNRGIVDTYILCIGLGFLGAHHFYLGRHGFGLLYLLTFGLCGVGWVVDWFRVPCLVKEANKPVDLTKPPQKSLVDAYILWFPLGLFGLHNFYLKRWVWGVVYCCTFGLFGIGWIIDGFRMKWLVKSVNSESVNSWPVKKSVSDAYIMTLCPISGLVGTQHYYLNRTGFGVGYTLTLGFLGVGWLADIFRMPHLVKSANHKMVAGDSGKVRLDDAYVLLFPLGFLGLHHFYLRRYGWGVLYLCTIGIFGIGWLVDFVRLPCLVIEYNRNIEEKLIAGDPAVIAVPGNIGVSNPAMNGNHSGVSHPQGGVLIAGAGTYGAVIPSQHPAQLPPYQPPYQQYPAPPPGAGYVYPPQGVAVGSAGPVHGPPQGPDSLVSIVSSEVDNPPSYSQATDESAQNSINEQLQPGAPPLPSKKE